MSGKDVGTSRKRCVWIYKVYVYCRRVPVQSSAGSTTGMLAVVPQAMNNGQNPIAPPLLTTGIERPLKFEIRVPARRVLQYWA